MLQHLASSKKAINVVQSMVPADILYPSPTSVSLSDRVVFKASRVDLLHRCPGENHQASNTGAEITDILTLHFDGHDRPAVPRCHPPRVMRPTHRKNRHI